MQVPEIIGSYRPPLATHMPVMGTYGPSMGPPGPGMEPPGPNIGPFWQHMEPPGQHMGPHEQHIGPSGQYMGHLGPSMGPTLPNTGFLEMSGSQMDSLEMRPIPKQVQSVIPNYSSPLSNPHVVQTVNQSADDLWVKSTAPTGQVYYYNSKTGISSWEKPQNVTQTQLEIAYNMITQGSSERGVSEFDAHCSAKMETPNVKYKTSQNYWNAVCNLPQTAELQPKQTEVTEWTEHLNPAVVSDYQVQSASVRPQVLVPLKEINMATEASQAQTSVQANAARNVKTDSEVIDTEVIEERKSELKAEQKKVTKSRPVASTPIPDTVWCVVRTNDGKHFFYNPTKRQSVWKMPEELKNRPDIEKLLPPKLEKRTEIKEEKDLQEEPPSKKIKLDAQVSEKNGESSGEVTQEIVLEKETSNAVEVQTAENMPVVSLEDKKNQFTEFLAENDVSTSSALLPSEERKLPFAEIVKNSTEEERMKRYMQIEGNYVLFCQLLEKSNLNANSTFKSFEYAHSHDERFGRVRFFRDRRYLFEDYINELSKQEKERNALITEKDSAHSELLPPQERKLTFAEIVKNRLEEERMKRYRQIEGNSELFRQLLEESNLNVNSTFQSFEDAHSHDERFGMVPIFDDKKYLFEDYISELSKQEEERNALMLKKVKKNFMKMLRKTPGIHLQTSWRDVSRILHSDPRYKAVDLDARRKNWFCEYKKNQNYKKKNFMKMLSETPGIAYYTPWRNAKKKFHLDPRYKAVYPISSRQTWFSKYLEAENNVKYYFLKMLSEIPDIETSTCWDDVKNKVSSDPQFKAVSDIRQKEWFKAYLKTLKHTTSDDLKNKKEQGKSADYSSLKEKDESVESYGETAIEDFTQFPVEKVASDDISKEEVQEKQLYSSSLKSENESWQDRRDAAFKDFKQFLVEKVKGTKLKFCTFKARFSKTPRWTMELSLKVKKQLYDTRVHDIHKKNQKILQSILNKMDLPLEAEWSEVKQRVQADPKFVYYTDNEEQLDEDYALLMHKKSLKLEDDFENCSSQSSSSETGQGIYSSW